MLPLITFLCEVSIKTLIFWIVFSFTINMSPVIISWMVAAYNGQEHTPGLKSIFMDYIMNTDLQ